ncbi:PX domain-containing protein [Metarhizium robertsii ARSEF 23]|uniref:Endosomal/vacuolar adapter protein YPT35 n=1 Tax=Metarhizium robertsii (strain ARSEF 23 / ATCC MYA-3075) TaxID=655844 RepID=E9F9M1_METRA|nr:PX domain-containing protein [Metarhizium robertsii ARSEF 23]EFY95514.2 PX domain-containing protein [Metarhizium robertsii ARSEF 23]
MASAVDQDQPVSGSHPDDETPALGFPTVDSDAATAPSSHKAQTLDDDDHVPQDTEDMMSSTLSNSSVASPPYWMNTHAHQRNTSSVSVESVLPAGAIILQDNDTSEHQDRNNACWAKSVEVVNYTVVNGGATSVGAFVVWNVRVETLSGSYMNIRKRYSEFDEFRSKLVKSFPGFEGAVPSLPPKSVISKFRPNFLEKRRTGLQYFLK